MLLLIWCSLLGPKTARNEVVINALVPEPTCSEIIAVFKGASTEWSDGSKVYIVVLPSQHVTTRVFAYKNFGLSSESFWGLVQKGLAKYPNNYKVVGSEAEMLRVLASHPGAIGYLSCLVPHDSIFVHVLDCFSGE